MPTVQLHSVPMWLSLFCSLIASVALHEAGHLLPALFLDFEVLGISFGPVRTSRMHGRWSFRIVPQRWFAASISTVPRTQRRWKERMLVVIAGGPVASLLAGIAAAIFASHVPLQLSLYGFFVFLAKLNFVIFTLGLIPNSRNARLRNDARLFWSILHDQDTEEIELYHRAIQSCTKGLRPRDYPALLIERMRTFKGRPLAMVFFANFVAEWAIDRDNLSTAESALAHALALAETCNAEIRNDTLAQSASFDLMFLGDIDAARKKFAAVNFAKLSPRFFAHRIQAAHAIANGHVPEALAHISRAAYDFPARSPYFEFQRELLNLLHRKAIAASSLALNRRAPAIAG